MNLKRLWNRAVEEHNDGEYHDTVFADKDLKEQVKELAISEYDNPSEIQVDKEPVVEELPF